MGHTLNGSIGYAPVPAAMAVMAFLVARRDRRAALGMLLGAALFVVSLALRTVDLELCSSWPVGTHVGWHLLNGVVVGVMVVVFMRAGDRREQVDGAAPRRTAYRPT